jgi:general nucleoside transport system permease protein
MRFSRASWARTLQSTGFVLASLILALAFGAGILLILGASPLEAYRLIAVGAFGTPVRVSYVLAAWAPVLLCSSGLLLTFAAGLWNIGIEGQVVLGAVFTTGVLRGLEHSGAGWVTLPLAAAAAALGGALWGWLAGALRAYGNVSEIFGGLGLNFIAGSLTVYLVLGPWARPGIASTSGTLPFPPKFWLPAVPAAGLAVPVEVMFGIGAIVAVSVALAGTYFGLRLKAIGKSMRSSYLRGIRTTREMLFAFAACGALAGLAGFVLVSGTYSRHQLFPLISGGYGFLAILVVLLAVQNPLACVAISAFFAAISQGSLQLPLQLQLDSSLSGVIEGTLVLVIILLRGLQTRLIHRRAEP